MYRFKGFTEKANTALNLAIEAAQRIGHTYIGTEHVVLGLLQEGTGVAGTVLAAHGITAEQYRDKIIESETTGQLTRLTPEDFTPRTKKAMEQAVAEAMSAGQGYVGTEHILMAILRDATGVAVRLLGTFGVRTDELLDELGGAIGSAAPQGKSGSAKPGGKSKTPTLDQFGRDLTAMAREGKLDPVIGRAEEIQRVVQILSRRT